MLIRNMIGEDRRFFPPSVEQRGQDHNYNENKALVQAIREGARGAYWDILRQMK